MVPTVPECDVDGWTTGVDAVVRCGVIAVKRARYAGRCATGFRNPVAQRPALRGCTGASQSQDRIRATTSRDQIDFLPYNQDMPEKLVIIGSGPAGWTAAIYAARANLDPLIYE